MVEENRPGAAFDLEKLKELIALMDQNGLTEIDLRQGDQRWRLRRGALAAPQMPLPGYAYQPAAAPALPTAPSSSGGGAAVKKPGEDDATPGLVIKSPTVGTFYSAPSPDDPPFVTVGSRVTPQTVVCTVEAMKVFNQITADLSGTVTAVLVNNGDPVEFGQPLFRVSVG